MLDCNLEYKKGESQTNMEFMQETDFRKILQLEENYIKDICDDIIALKPDLVLTGLFFVLLEKIKISGLTYFDCVNGF